MTLLALMAAFAVAVPAVAQIIVSAPGGSFAFSDLKLSSSKPEVTGTIDNRTGSEWSGADFSVTSSVTLHGVNSEPRTFTLSLTSIPLGKTQFREYPHKVSPSYPKGLSATGFRISFVDGDSQAMIDARTAERQRRAEAAEAKKQMEQAARDAFLAKFPIIQSGGESSFIGADRQCAIEFSQALTMEGLAKRKKIAELVSFQCGFIVPAGTHVAVKEKQDGYALVVVVDGTHSTKAGWIPILWLTGPGVGK
ncbi:MAG: hypothetical protein WD696_03595 [Bryobacteraceae bacterium]